MENLFVSYEIAKQLKEKGFDEKCLAWYCKDMNILYANLYNGNPIEGNNPPIPKQIDLYAPLYQQVIDWFREKKEIIITIRPMNKGEYFFYSFTSVNETVLNSIEEKTREVNNNWNYKQALEKAIKEALKLI